MPAIGYNQVPCSNAVPKDSTALVIPDGATYAWLQANTEGDVNYTLHETVSLAQPGPGSSRGMVLRKTDPPLQVLIEDLQNIRFVASNDDTHLNVIYFR